MKKITKLAVSVFMVVLLIVFCMFSVFAVTDSTETEVDSVGASETLIQTGLLATPSISTVYNSGRDVTISWESIDGAYKYRVFYKNGSSWKKIGETEETEFVWSSAVFNKEYVYTVRCIDENGKFTSDFNRGGYAYTAKLDEPVLDQAVIDDGDVKITWNPVEGVYNYRVFYKGGTQKTWKKIADTTDTSYKWSGATYNTAYIFTVRCVGKEGNFESDYNKDGVKCTTKIDMPVIKNVTSSGSSAVISWDEIEGAGNYKVFYKNGSSWKTIATTDKTTYTYKNVTLGKSMTYTVRCVNTDGKFVSAFDSNGYTYTVNLETPIIKSVTTQGLTSAKLEWDKVSGATKYRVFYKNGSSWKKIGDTANTSYTVNKMNAKTTYVFTIRCVSKNGDFESKFDSKGYSHRNYLSEIPQITAVEKESESSVSISHSSVSGVEKYRLYYKGGSQSGWKIIANTEDNPFVWKYVEPNESLTYTIRCLAPNGDVISDYNASGYTYKLSSSLLQTPKMTSVQYADGKVYVKWNAVAKASKYAVRTSSDNGANWKQIGTSSTNSFSIKASPNTSLLYSVVCINSSGSAVSGFDTAKLTAIEFDAPVLNRSSSVIKFTWNNIGADKYEIYRNYYKTDGYQYYKTVTGKNTFEDTSIEEGRGYFYKVKAVFDDGKVTYMSDPVKAVAGLCAPATSITSRLRRFNIDWDGISFAEGYEIFYSTDNKTFKLLDRTDRWFYNTPRLTDGKKYYFRIRPYKHVGDDLVVGTYKAVSGTCTSYAYGSYVGNTYVEVSKNQQFMWLYVNGELKVETPVVTGNYGTSDTPSGYHKMWQIESPATLVGDGYVTPVSYWMAFTYDGCGIHDATWRDSFGGNIYKGNGSHGCVNTPYDEVKEIYYYSYIGMPVIVYP